MRWKLLKELPRLKVGSIIESAGIGGHQVFSFSAPDFPDFFEPIPDEPERRWKPKEGATVYTISWRGEVDSFTWWENFHNQEALNFGNGFRIREQAEEARDAIKKLLSELHKKWKE